MNVLEKLAQVQQKLAVPKNNTNSFAKYNYRNVEDIEKAVKPLLKEVKATIVLNDEMVEVGGRVYVKATAKFIDLDLMDTDSNIDYMEASAYAREAVDKKGMDDSQLTGATSSYARKYALGGLLLIDNEKDSDSTNTHGKVAPKTPTEPSPRKETANLADELTAKKNQIRELYKATGDTRPITDFLIETIGVAKIDVIEDANQVLEALDDTANK